MYKNILFFVVALGSIQASQDNTIYILHAYTRDLSESLGLSLLPFVADKEEKVYDLEQKARRMHKIKAKFVCIKINGKELGDVMHDGCSKDIKVKELKKNSRVGFYYDSRLGQDRLPPSKKSKGNAECVVFLLVAVPATIALFFYFNSKKKEINPTRKENVTHLRR